MQLCFDATRFGFGLEEAIELAAAKKLPSVAFTFQPFSTSAKQASGLAKKELSYLASVKKLAADKQVELACLNLDGCVNVDDKKMVSQFQTMVSRLAAVAQALGALRLSFSLEPGSGEDWQKAASDALNPAVETCARAGAKLLVRTGTPSNCKGLSLSRWSPGNPQLWRDLLSFCPGLSLSFSPADCLWQGIDYLSLLPQLVSAIEHVEANDVEVNRELVLDSGLFGPLWWRYRLPGKGQVDWRQLVEALKLYDYSGCLSIHLDDEFVEPEYLALDSALDHCVSVLAPLARG